MKKYFIFLLLLVGSNVWAQSRITSIEIQNGTHVSIEQIKQVLPIHVGDLYDPTRVEQAISYLKKWGRFEKVDAQVGLTAKGVHLKFVVQEGSLVSGINLDGGYPFLSTRLRRVITLHTSDLYDPNLASEQKKRLEDFYLRKGFEGTEVDLDTVFNQEKGTVDLIYRIRKGSPYRLGKVTVLGNTVFPDGYFVSQLNPLRHYEQGRFRRKLEKIRKDYQKKGYLKARVRLKDLGQDPATKMLRPTLEITEGKKVTVVFDGNHRVSKRTFKKILPLFTDGGYGNYEIEESVNEIKVYYRSLGFQETTATVEKKEIDADHLRIRFLIDEGPQTRVKKVTIDGNHEISEQKIKKELFTQENTLFQKGYYRPKTVEEDEKVLPQILKNYGALEGRALGVDTSFNQFRDKVQVTFKVEEGEISRIGEVLFTGNEHLPSRFFKGLLTAGPGDPVSLAKIEDDKQEMTLAYSNHGFPYAEIRTELQKTGENFSLVYHIREGLFVRIGEILTVGNERTTSKAVERALFIKKGDPFSYKKIVESESALRKTAAFRSAHIETIGLAEKEPVVHLLVELEENRKVLMDFGVTYATDNFFTGNYTLSHLNLFGTTKSGILKLTGGRDIQSGESILKDPFFLGHRLEASLGALVKREDRPAFTTTDAGTSLSFLKEFTPQVTFLSRYALTRTLFSNVLDATGAQEQDHTISKFSFSVNLDKRDSFSDPKKGYVTFAGVDLSNKIFASSVDFIALKGYAAKYFEFGNRVTFLNFVRSEGIKVIGAGALTRDQRFFLGGDYSVRGFDEDSLGPIGADGRPLGGQVLLAATTELQVRLFKELKLALFVDHGSVSQNFSDFGLESIRHSAGGGLRYITPVGPIRLDYGVKLDRTSHVINGVSTEEPFGRLHFAFGYAF